MERRRGEEGRSGVGGDGEGERGSGVPRSPTTGLRVVLGGEGRFFMRMLPHVETHTSLDSRVGEEEAQLEV